jgi:chemotaxis protein CheC
MLPDESNTFDEEFIKTMTELAAAGIKNAAQGFSGLLGHKIDVTPPIVRVVSLFDIPKLTGGPEKEAIGIYLRAEGDISGQIMLILPLLKAMELVDLLMDLDTGTTKTLGTVERSALGEVGNMTGAFFLNAVANMTKTSIRPTPPAVIVDMVGAILDIIIATTGGVSEYVLLMESNFMDGNRVVEADFWVIPDALTLHLLKIRDTDKNE